MDAYRQIHQSIHIDAPVTDVWSVFVNPSLSHKLGGEYITDWKPGSSIGWKDKDNVFQSKGIILENIEGKLLKIQLEDLSDPNEILSTITYEFEDNPPSTKLIVEEKIHYPLNNEEYHEACQVWREMLFAIAETAEKIGMQ